MKALSNDARAVALHASMFGPVLTSAKKRWQAVLKLHLGPGLLLLLSLLSYFHSSAQMPSAFDLIPRLSAPRQALALGIVDTLTSDSQSTVLFAGNPFNIIRHGDASFARALPQRIDPLVAAGLERVPGTEVGADRGTFDTVLCFVLLLLLSLSYVLQGQSLKRMFAAAINQNFLGRLLREQQLGSYFVWAFLGALILASYLYVSVRELRPELLSTRWTALDGFMLGVLGLTLLKLTALQVLRFAFPLGKPLRAYQALIVIWLAILGVVVFPLLVLVSFGSGQIAVWVAWAAGPLIVIALLARSSFALVSAGSVVTQYPLHFFLYLCALEISPLLVVYTWLVRS